MRKILIALFLFITLSFHAKAQKDSLKFNYGINISLPLLIKGDWALNPALSLFYNKNEVLIGIFFGPVYYPGYFTPGPYVFDGYKINGVNAIYKFYPNRMRKHTDLNVQYEISYQSHSVKDMNDDFSPLNTFSSKNEGLIQTVGYGVRVKFLKYMYLSHNIGFGVGYNYQSVHHTMPQLWDYTRSGWYPLLIFRLGIGFNMRKING